MATMQRKTQQSMARSGTQPAVPVRCSLGQQSVRTTQLRVLVVAQAGFGKPQKGKASTASKQKSAPKPTAPAKAAVVTTDLVGTATPVELKKGNWIDILPNVEDWFVKAGKDMKALTLEAGRTLMLYRHQGVVYCTDVNSTAYQFPLVDAEVSADGPLGGPTVKVPLDGTVYDLKTGRVLVWCPKNESNLMLNVLTTIKRASDPVDLPVFPTQVTETGGLRVRL